MTSGIERGDGVGIELTRDVLRAVRLSHESSSVAAAAEVAVRDPDDEHALLDAFVRARALLGNPVLPVRIALFPAPAVMWRTDVTARSGPELQRVRWDLDRHHGVGATVLVDDPDRRWLHALHWATPDPRRIEELAERAGLLDAATEPSPLALGRVCAPGTKVVERVATTGERVVVAFADAHPVAAATIESVGHADAALHVGCDPFDAARLDGSSDPFTIAAALTALGGRASNADVELRINGIPYPRFPPADLRSPARQCVALGAAVGAAGLVGRLRPIDVVEPPDGELAMRPWAVEPVSVLPPLAVAGQPSATRRLTARLVPRRRG